LDLTDLLFEFSNKERYKILKSLDGNSKKHRQIEIDLSIPGSEVSRHLKRLSQKDLIYKNIANEYEITNVGKMFLKMMDIFEVSLKHKDFLNTHEITSIPVHLIFQLGKLMNLELGDKTMENMEIFENLVKEAEEFLFTITDQYQKTLLKEAEQKLKSQSIMIRALVDQSVLKSYNIPEGWSTLFEDSQSFFKNFKIFENVRILEEIKLSLVVSEKGGILFLSKDGEIDYSQCLLDNHEFFVNWIKELFEWYWEKGKNLKSFINKEIYSTK